MDTVCVGREAAFATFPAVLLAEWQNIAAVAAPVGRHIRVRLEPVRNSVVDLLFIRISLGIALADAFRNDRRVTFSVTKILAIFALHACRVLKEVAAQCTTHNVVELVLHELVSVHLVDFLLSLTDSALSPKTKVDWSAVLVGLGEVELELNLSSRLEVEPSLDRTSVDLRLRTRCSVSALPTGTTRGHWLSSGAERTL